MDNQDKTFRQAVEELSKQRFLLSEEAFYERMASFAPIVQQALQDGRTIESVTKHYFPVEYEQKVVTSIYRAALLRTVLDTSLKDGKISETAHHELLSFLFEMVKETPGWEKPDRD